MRLGDPPPQSERAKSARILLIQDHEELRGRITAALEAQEYEIITAEDGTQGLLKFMRDEPDVVVLDLELSGMYGMRVLGEIRERSPHVPVIFLTSDHAPVDSAIPSVTILRKPFHTDWLLGDVRRALGTSNGGGMPPGGLHTVRQL
jgi:DNA-binding response OmpR family regulator